jgi:hypothetical protein
MEHKRDADAAGLAPTYGSILTEYHPITGRLVIGSPGAVIIAGSRQSLDPIEDVFRNTWIPASYSISSFGTSSHYPSSSWSLQ